MKTMKNFRDTNGVIEYESVVEEFTSGGAYIPASKKHAGRKVKVLVLPNVQNNLP